MTQDKPTWEKTAFDLIEVLRQRSDDIHTKVGALILDNSNRVVSMGYNGLPKGVSPFAERLSRKNGEKYKWMVHAEQNAIQFANKNDLSDCTLYVSFLPCTGCAQSVIQSGIKKVVMDEDMYTLRKKSSGVNYEHERLTVFKMFEEAKVNIYLYNKTTDIKFVLTLDSSSQTL